MQTPQIQDNILQTLGDTPLVRLNKVTASLDSGAVEIIAKVESFNPGGSVKDRIGIAMIEDAEKRGVLKPGGTIVECTSGNTGMGLAIAAAVKGYKCIFVMPDKMSAEKIRNLRAFGAKVVITPTAVEPDDPRSYYSVARQLAKETPNAVHMNQYDNLSNRQAHYRSTGPELWKQLDGEFDAFVAGMGTGGTITGTGMYLKEKNKNIQIVGVDPIGSILHDYFKTGKMTNAHTYKIEGIGEDIIPQNYDFKFIDDVMQVNDKESYQMTRALVQKEGIFCGVSAGAAVCGAMKYARKMLSAGWAGKSGSKKRIVALLPDSGDRYLSKVFDDDWMRENGFLESGWGSVRDLIEAVKPPTRKAILTAEPGDSVGKIVNLMRDKGVSQIPVVKGKNGIGLVGLVQESNLLSALFNGKLHANDSIAGITENKFTQVSLDDDLERLSQSIAAGLTPIVVEGGEIISIVSKIDLISYMSRK